MAAKRIKLFYSKFQPNKCAKRHHIDNDWISELPDDILIAIISFLPLKEAARTSVLSTRWINLSEHTPRLNFNAESALKRIDMQYKLRKEERLKYKKWVNRVLRSNKAPTLTEFIICFDLSKSFSKAITQWLKFAFSRHVQRLDLNFSAKSDNSANIIGNYVFPEELLLTPSIGTTASFNFKSLKSLSFKCVIVTSEAIEFFLHNCPLLEHLVVEDTDKIINLEVCGPSLVLKNLELRFCYDLESIKISAPNLTSLTVSRSNGLLLEYVPKLVEVSVNCVQDSLKCFLRTFSCCIFQLGILKLHIGNPKEIIKELRKFPELPNLKKLVIMCYTSCDESLIELAYLIKASPYLREFVLEEVLFHSSPLKKGRKCSCCSRRSDYGKIKNVVPGFRHEHLKVVKYNGFYGHPGDLEFVRYILDTCGVLEKLIVDPRYSNDSSETLEPYELEEKLIARDNAKKLLEETPNIKFVIL